METAPQVPVNEDEPVDNENQFEQLLANNPAEAVKAARTALANAERRHDYEAINTWRNREKEARLNEIERFPDDYTGQEEVWVSQWIEKMRHVYNEILIWRKENGLIGIEPEHFRMLVIKLARAQSAIGHQTEAEDLINHYDLTNSDIDLPKAA